MIALNDIHFRYKKKKQLFENLNLSLQPGFIYGLLGKNGAGKSSLLKLISGLLYPDSGECRVFGYDASARKPAMLQDIYLVPEEFNLPPISLATFVNINSVFYSKFSHNQLQAYLAEFELQEEDKLSTLSYGQKKKFLIAFGLATNARLLILDEPTNGLDIPSKSQFRKIMAASLDEDKIIVISTHQVRDLENLIDNIVVLEHGNIIFNQNIAAISERLAFEYNLAGIPEGEVLYAEELQGRKAGIVKNLSGQDSRVDLELLFNGIIKNAPVINEQFAKLNYEY
ncbi:ABC-2 type transport system ATP-binding protein [Pontibacter ummariensis]|uniref:ABC-2 type transport system ATP-binding protein n=1 Tax=Pontibacter ummariensis TaxID=1610492 RepID=A0A239KA61_9BACT|nr:ABC transporter ATP-binding protein [Pontibacter ummariensis]PRY06075.1 ABC-2 type transport system ATP-binding protein [Pontibacter ummariensis]SNT14975.1 ABC-2 type transport system ATP-binding protein [Pontibacter ummariensis]